MNTAPVFWKMVVKYARLKNRTNYYIAIHYSMESLYIYRPLYLHQGMDDSVAHDPSVAQSTYNANELRFLYHYLHPMCYVMDVMTNLRQYN